MTDKQLNHHLLEDGDDTMNRKNFSKIEIAP